MNRTIPTGWEILRQGFPWFTGKERFPLPAYSEFMPPPRLGISPLGEKDLTLFSGQDQHGWSISEIEEEYELGPGLKHLADQIMGSLVRLGRGEMDHHLAGHKGRNLENNPYWPPELSIHAGDLAKERYVVFLALALSRTQDDKGRVRWTFFGSSEQGPEQAFWKGFYSAPGQEIPKQKALSFFVRLLSSAYSVSLADGDGLHTNGFRILPTQPDARFPYWPEEHLPSWTQPFIVDSSASFEDVRYLLAFEPFSRLPSRVKNRYMDGNLALLPFPGSLLFWGQESYIRLQEHLPLAIQMPLLRIVARHGASGGVRIPQSGWLHEPGSDQKSSEVRPELLVNTYRRTSRWDRVHRHEDDVTLSTLEDKVVRVLFSTTPDALGLYDKPMARNCQIWTEGSQLLLDGPNATPDQIANAAKEINKGGHFRYRFQFPAMRVGIHEIYWHRPLVAYWSEEKDRVEVMTETPLGFMTAYDANSPDPAAPVLLWPRLLRREAYVAALQSFDQLIKHYAYQTPLNILTLLDCFKLWGERSLPRSFAGHLLRVAEHGTPDAGLPWLALQRSDSARNKIIMDELERIIEPPTPRPEGSDDKAAAQNLPEAITYAETATRSFEEGLWNDILFLSQGTYINKENADCVQDPVTLSSLKHRYRDLEALGDYLLGRHRQSISAAGMEGKALCGEIPFHWRTDFDFSLFGGWKNNRDGHTYERDILVMIPGKNRREAVVLADHYDTAYMEDVFDKSRGGNGARLAAAGADDNHSATATLLQAAPVFLKLSKEGRLERDVWLLHLTGEEFPADCMGARHFCQALVEKTLEMRLSGDDSLNLSGVRVVGVLVMDMIAHNRESEKDVFQISPGKGAKSLRLAWQAHLANMIWNKQTEEWNRSAGRHGLDRGKRSPDGSRIPDPALHPVLRGEVRTLDNPQSSLYNTDGQIFSDVGVPVVLLMENYDINRQGYHDKHDTMENIDLDYGAAVAAIAIEAAARTANDQDF
jgi:hypothetical protein